MLKSSSTVSSETSTYDQISAALRDMGYDFSAKQCRTKVENRSTIRIVTATVQAIFTL